MNQILYNKIRRIKYQNEGRSYQKIHFVFLFLVHSPLHRPTSITWNTRNNVSIKLWINPVSGLIREHECSWWWGKKIKKSYSQASLAEKLSCTEGNILAKLLPINKISYTAWNLHPPQPLCLPRSGRHLKNVYPCLTAIHLSLIFGFFKCLPFCVCLAYTSETWLHY